MEYIVLTTSITEPVTKEEVKSFMAYSGTDQDDLIDSMIITAREWLEQRTGLSLISKSYKARFEKEDSEDGWYRLPLSPVLASPVITCSMNGVSTTFQQTGLKQVRVRPDTVISTVQAGASSEVSYLEVTFQAGATNNTANTCLLSIVSQMFNYREGGIGVNMARLDFDTLKMIKSISVNL
jgi:uncharacterized phiE125 gp8 family phage protein